jgi:hypothetical protein
MSAFDPRMKFRLPLRGPIVTARVHKLQEAAGRLAAMGGAPL